MTSAADRRLVPPVVQVLTAPAIALAVTIFGGMRRSASVVVTSHGVAAGGLFVRWEQIGAVQRDKDGGHLHLRTPGDPRSVDIGGLRCAVSDERLVEVIEFYLANPRRRSALDTGPDQLALPIRRGGTQTPSTAALYNWRRR
ncbi:MAG TPA: hypothetical protein VFY84_14705 [Jiangellales bacterium]|nr:hypothetical protein [Jiangellales bacterium]